MLVKAGILTSRVGGTYEQRGSMFAKDPKEITLYDIVYALEDDEPVECCGDILKLQTSKMQRLQHTQRVTKGDGSS